MAPSLGTQSEHLQAGPGWPAVIANGNHVSNDSPPDSEGHTGPSQNSSDPTDTGSTLSLQSRIDNSDTAKQSQWSQKIIVSLDGGGIRGYSSLLILEALMSIVEDLERGRATKAVSKKSDHNKKARELDAVDQKVPQNVERFSECYSSDDYPWRRRYRRASSVHPKSRELNGDLARANGPDPETGSPQGAIGSFRLHHYVDYMAGTSTGGLSAIMLSRLKMTVKEALNQYDVVGNKVFGQPRKLHFHRLGRSKYNAVGMESALKEVIDSAFPRNPSTVQSIGSRTDKPLVVELANENPDACHTAVIAKGGYLDTSYIFRSYDHPHPGKNVKLKDTGVQRNPGPAHRVNLVDVARATSAAPGYFEQKEVDHEFFVDGGMGANNPTELACQDVQQLYGMRPPTLVISIGTGLPPETQTRTKNPWRTPWRHLMSMLNTVDAMQKIVTDAEETHHRVQKSYKQLEGSEQYRDHRYFRFNVPDISHIELDEWIQPDSGKETKFKLRVATEKYLRKRETQRHLAKCATLLVETRRARAKTERWETFATDEVYGCPERSCKKLIPGVCRAELRQHGFEEHGLVWQVKLRQQAAISERNADGLSPEDHYMCIWDHCGQLSPIMFDSKEAFYEHLEGPSHEIVEPELKTLHELEAWLDDGRTTAAEIRRQDTDTSDHSESGPGAIGMLSPGPNVVTQEPSRYDSTESSAAPSIAPLLGPNGN